MDEKPQIDSLDRKILKLMREDSRVPFLEIARILKVSGGTIHARVKKLKESGVISGTKLVLDPHKLGLDVSALIGVKVSQAGAFKPVIEKLQNIPEVVEVYYTTGSFSLLLKLCVPTIRELHRVLSDEIQKIEAIHSTETYVILDTPIYRDLPL